MGSLLLCKQPLENEVIVKIATWRQVIFLMLVVPFADKFRICCTLKSRLRCVKFIPVVRKGSIMIAITLSKKAKKRSPI